MEEVPSVEFIQKWQDAQPFIIKPATITGICRNIDIDAVVFKYTTTIEKDIFWNTLQANLKGTKWKLVSKSPQSRAYERRFSKGAQSPDRPDMAMFSSAEMMRIEYVPDKQRVVVGYVQADSSEADTSFEATHEAIWAAKEIWHRLEKAKKE